MLSYASSIGCTRNVTTNAKMKHTILLFLSILICFKTAHAHNSLSETEKLAATAKIWDFLKYYHPHVASGKFKWDDELFKVLPKVKAASTKEELSQVYIAWLDNLGRVKACKNCKQESSLEYFDRNFDLSWIKENQVFTAELTERLKHVEQNRHQGKKYYVSAGKKIGNIEVTNEINYKGFSWNDENLRLLTLFRYWNIVEYFFPYKYQMDTNWDEVLSNMIPKFLHPKTELEYQLAILELVVSIDDSHAGYYNDTIAAYFGHYWMPAHFKLIDKRAIITGFYNDFLARVDDIRIGDIITRVDGQEVEGIFSQKEKYISGSNISRKKLNAFHSIFNGSSDSVQIEFIRNNQTATKTIKRYLLDELNPKAKEAEKFKILKGNIGYVDMGRLELKDVEGIMEALKGTKAIIFDIRNHPKGTFRSVANYISSKRNDFYKVIYPDLGYPGKFIWRNGDQIGQSGDLKYKGKVVLLVNERAQSHAEFTIMGLQTGDNVTTIGSQTSGADGNVSVFELVGGHKTAITGIGIFYPDNTETQRKGVKIDIEVKPTVQGIIEGKDEVLEKAIEFVNTNT
ncbi:C-terminal processing protease CtpA/Prc, contains a PDZ domain [Pontibacter chinhatensis]|uniref:C-terminal processing protease CtpA/Prc, contains a PDZ domain n=2 Tax=Pontibacter chinhatensis TaxID=1436961 RepID=A0A1I2Y201_9BACT|nr:C-terminal processing protease CtpA/Prc, contains a PDZ domain [Pontibacter chinhatensis]